MPIEIMQKKGAEENTLLIYIYYLTGLEGMLMRLVNQYQNDKIEFIITY